MNEKAGYVLSTTRFDAPALACGLYVVSTPIGNLRDITLRALETLAAADLILCEDTRTSARLLDHFDIRRPRQPLHEHNERGRITDIVRRIADGGAIALICDAGTPLLSDPGFPLLRALAEENMPVFPVPGASALLAGLVIAGLPTDAFSFFGFPPAKSGARSTELKALADRRETLVFYESPRRLAATLKDMEQAFGGERSAAVALELTKKFERVRRGPLAMLAQQFSAEATRGEAVILVAGLTEQRVADEDWQAALAAALEDQPVRAAVDSVADAYGLRRKQVYDAALALRAAR